MRDFKIYLLRIKPFQAEQQTKQAKIAADASHNQNKLQIANKIADNNQKQHLDKQFEAAAKKIVKPNFRLQK